MKKKIIAVLLTLTLVFSLSGCKGKDSGESVTDTETDTEAVIPATEAAAPATETETTVPFDSTGYTQFSNVYYILSPDWTFYSDNNGTQVYQLADNRESFAIFVQNETDYTADNMYTAYDSTITSTYGSRGTTETVTIGSLEWHVYHFTGDNDLNTATGIDVYVYSDGATTIYIENAFSADGTASGKIQELLNSIVIQ